MAESESEITDTDASNNWTNSDDSDDWTNTDDSDNWVNSYLSHSRTKFFCKVDRSFLHDRFEHYGLDEHFDSYCEFQESYRCVLTSDSGYRRYRRCNEGCEMMYGLLHARYIMTKKGMERMAEKFLEGDFGICPNVSCGKQHVLPIGLYDKVGLVSVRVYCPKCEDVYIPPDKEIQNVDGAYFGPWFPHMFLMVYPQYRPEPAPKYVEKIYGFKLHPTAYDCQLKVSKEYKLKQKERKKLKMESDGSEDTLDYLSSDSEYTSDWITWYMNAFEHYYLVKVDRRFIMDSSNNFRKDYFEGLQEHFETMEEFDRCLSVITGKKPETDKLDENVCRLYGLLHARYILTWRGLLKMLKKAVNGDFGTCPRYYCRNQAVLPVGLSDKPGKNRVKLYCPKCRGVYIPKRSHRHIMDGSCIGTTFPHLLFMLFPKRRPQPSSTQFIPKLYGFKIHKSAYELQLKAGREMKAAEEKMLAEKKENAVKLVGSWLEGCDPDKMEVPEDIIKDVNPEDLLHLDNIKRDSSLVVNGMEFDDQQPSLNQEKKSNSEKAVENETGCKSGILNQENVTGLEKQLKGEMETGDQSDMLKQKKTTDLKEPVKDDFEVDDQIKRLSLELISSSEHLVKNEMEVDIQSEDKTGRHDLENKVDLVSKDMQERHDSENKVDMQPKDTQEGHDLKNKVDVQSEDKERHDLENKIDIQSEDMQERPNLENKLESDQDIEYTTALSVSALSNNNVNIGSETTLEGMKCSSTELFIKNIDDVTEEKITSDNQSLKLISSSDQVLVKDEVNLCGGKDEAKLESDSKTNSDVEKSENVSKNSDKFSEPERDNITSCMSEDLSETKLSKDVVSDKSANEDNDTCSEKKEIVSYNQSVDLGSDQNRMKNEAKILDEIELTVSPDLCDKRKRDSTDSNSSRGSQVEKKRLRSKTL